MHTGVKLSISVIALALSLGCGPKDSKDLKLDSVPAAQNSSVQNLSMTSPVKGDSQSVRPSLGIKTDSAVKRDSSVSKDSGSTANRESLATGPKSEFVRSEASVDELKQKIAVSVPVQMPSRMEENQPTADARAIADAKSDKSMLGSEEIIGLRRKVVGYSNKEQAPHGREVEAEAGTVVRSQATVQQAKDLSEKYEGMKARSKRFYQVALGFLGKQDDSALIYANKAIQAYENGSLFRVKAEALYNLQYFTNSEIACDVCINRTDHWDGADVDRALKLKSGCYKQNYKRFPSQESKEQYENSCKAAGVPIGGK